MIYNPGHIHESLKKERYYEIKKSFVMLICIDKSIADFAKVEDWDSTEALSLESGDIIVTRFNKPIGWSDAYVYLERVIKGESITEYKIETIVSKEFIDINNTIFVDITKSIIRDNKINDILK
jgi:hypothetical protein